MTSTTNVSPAWPLEVHASSSTGSSEIYGSDSATPSPWDNLTLGQVLLPLLCAVFITVVLVVIACCLIQKKTRASDQQHREKSCHTLETSHDISDGGIYDLIDEINVCSYSPQRSSRRQHQLSSNCVFVSSHDKSQRKNGPAFTISSSALPYCGALKTDPAPSKPCTIPADLKQMQHTTPGFVSLGDTSDVVAGRLDSYNDEEEGIYETLDRYWTFKNAKGCNKCSEADGKTHVQKDGSADNCRTSTLRSTYASELEEGSSKSAHQTFDQVTTSPPTFPCPAPTSKAGKSKYETTLCQIRLFTVSDTEQDPYFLHSAMYNVYIQPPPHSMENTHDISPILHNVNLRLVPEKVTTDDDSKENFANVILKPVEDKDLQKHVQFVDSQIQQSPAHRIMTKIYEKPYSSKRNPKLLAKKSESFRDASSELKAMKEQALNHRRCSDSCHLGHRLTSVGQGNTARVEVKRILTKLGPLPPLPAQQTDRSTKSTSLTPVYRGSAEKLSNNMTTQFERELLPPPPPPPPPPFPDDTISNSVPHTEQMKLWRTNVANTGHTFPPLSCRNSARKDRATRACQHNLPAVGSAMGNRSTESHSNVHHWSDRKTSNISTGPDVGKLSHHVRSKKNSDAEHRTQGSFPSEGREPEDENSEDEKLSHYFELEPYAESTDSLTSGDEDGGDTNGM